MLLTINEAMTLYKNKEFKTLVEKLWIAPKNTKSLIKRTKNLLRYFHEIADNFSPDYKVFFDEKSNYGTYHDTIRICFHDRYSDNQIYKLIHGGTGRECLVFEVTLRNFDIGLYSMNCFRETWGNSSADDFYDYKKKTANIF